MPTTRPSRAIASRPIVVAGLLALVWPTAGRAEVLVDGGDVTCFDGRAMLARLEQVLRGAPADRARQLALRVRVVARASASASASGQAEVLLAAETSGGETLLERRYELSAADCASVVDLLALVMERFLASFPAERWRELERAAAQTARPERRVELAAHLAAFAALAPTGGDLALGVAVDYGSPRHRLGGTLEARGALPRSLGQGRFVEIDVLLGARWRYAAWAWQPTAALRGGLTALLGYGYDVSYRRAVPCLEAVAGLDRRWARIALGLEVAVSLLPHHVVTEDRSISEGLPIVRLGLRLTLPIRGKKL